MANKNDGSEDTKGAADTPAKEGGDSASRARNRTVMLTPDVTGEVRARLAQEPAAPTRALGLPGFTAPQAAESGSKFTQSSGNDFVSPKPAGGGGFTAPTPRAPQPAPAVAPKTSGAEGAVWSKESPLVGFLVSFDVNKNGAVYELRSGRLIVTSEAAGSGNFLVINHTSVSPMHAIIRVTAEGEIQVLDQLSEHGTRIRRHGSEQEEQLSGEKGSIDHGDVISFGERSFHVCLISRG